MIRETMKRAVAAFGIIALAASASNAQQASASPKWRGWIGCWAPAPSTDAVFETPTSRMVVCITPTSNPEVVTFTTIDNGKVAMQQPLDASGREQPVTADKCDGTQRAKWSADERRIFLSSSGT